MIFLSVIVALALVQWWGSGAPLQRDGWYFTWVGFLRKRPLLDHLPAARLLLAVLVPSLLLGLLIWGLSRWLSPAWVFFVAVPVLLYSLGRGDFSDTVKAYLMAANRGDSVAAGQLLTQMGGTAFQEYEHSADDWFGLHRQALTLISYRGFERMFAVLFWFFVLGPVGALLYRLSLLYRESSDGALVQRWVWLLEWPAVRVMGLTLAMTGNFETCFPRWQRGLVDFSSGSAVLLREQLLGALGAPEAQAGESDGSARTSEVPVGSGASVESAQGLIRASLPLFSRSLLLWVCLLALVTLLV